jgi:Concanavalin A-like lectin/glucanases superfamily
MLLIPCMRTRRSTAVPLTDPYWANVVLLMGMETPGSPQGFVDESPVGRALSIVNNAFPDSAQKKFGSYSARFDGNADAITAPDSADWTFGAGEAFTIECFVRFASLPTAEGGCNFVGHCNTTGNLRSWAFALITTTSPDRIRFTYSTDGVAFNPIDGNWVAAIDTWYHVAVARQTGGTILTFVDGVQFGSGSDARAMFNSTDLLRIGLLNAGAGSRFWMDGWIDELRITKGVARYTGAFAPPTAAFPRG